MDILEIKIETIIVFYFLSKPHMHNGGQEARYYIEKQSQVKQTQTMTIDTGYYSPVEPDSPLSSPHQHKPVLEISPISSPHQHTPVLEISPRYQELSNRMKSLSFEVDTHYKELETLSKTSNQLYDEILITRRLNEKLVDNNYKLGVTLCLVTLSFGTFELFNYFKK